MLCDPMDCSQPDSSVHGILQARILEWVAISFSRGSFWPRDWTHISYISCIGKRILYHCATWLLLERSGSFIIAPQWMKNKEKTPFFPLKISSVTTFSRLRYPQVLSLSFQSALQGFSSRSLIRLCSRGPAGARWCSEVFTSHGPSPVLRHSTQWSESGGKHLTTLVFLFGPNVVDSLTLFLRSTPDCQLAFFKKKKKKLSRVRYSNHWANGIMGSHYKTLSKLSLHASKSKKLIYCHYTVERGN